MKPEHKEAGEEEFEADIEKEPDDELELEAWDSADDEGGLSLDDEIGGYNEGIESKLEKFSPEY